MIENAKGASAFLNGRDGTEDDELIVVKAGAGVVINEDMLRWSDDAAFAAPYFV